MTIKLKPGVPHLVSFSGQISFAGVKDGAAIICLGDPHETAQDVSREAEKMAANLTRIHHKRQNRRRQSDQSEA